MSKKLHNILLVEDEDDIQLISKIALHDIGNMHVEICGSGQEALTKLNHFHPDVILLDMMMPGMDGIQTLQELRRHSVAKAIPVIFMTAKVLSNEISQYRQLGVLDVITKPFDPLTLAQKVRDIFSATEGEQNE